ncbi:MAG: hypothetical protein WKF58_02670 [Ilumatobacteraceae bacterium]
MPTSTLREVEAVLTDVAQRGRAISAASGTWARRPNPRARTHARHAVESAGGDRCTM